MERQEGDTDARRTPRTASKFCASNKWRKTIMGKKKVLARITDFLGLYDSDKYDPEDLDEDGLEPDEEEKEERKPVPLSKAEETSPEKPKKSFFSRSKKNSGKNLIQMKATTDIRVIVLEPEGFDDCKNIADCLAKDQPVVVNFENTDTAVKRRITDFVTGTVYALNGTIRNIGPNILVCAPHNVNIDAEAELYGENRGE